MKDMESLGMIELAMVFLGPVVVYVWVTWAGRTARNRDDERPD